MSQISVERSHSLGLETARAKAGALAEKLTRDYGVECRWEGDTLQFSRTGVDGRIEVGEDKVRVDATLGFFFSALSSQIEHEIEKKLDKALQA
ncbi:MULTISPECIES: polyhydroxyalkanoic acid system family protein [Pseudomonas]|uniref:Polyhydroxyalkanoic acid system family protein n=1 Tax=Pseudomonas luteola TaxID=47886 RepID=A0ABS0MQQ7_PSELU|nr:MULTISPECIES: polyhydroxyalkanoic acid system family protein [Pseudomonas]MBF8639672.1 polyhydroxyalkanoic acid system family protein [Pseudomonas zeshuii]MBH3439067.1 polyhydroxyalkanoic acid system family protein [Pseudomonas luteola]MBW5411871.1 polyhydroxyalkanoic acid system protein [Pseudomonas sp. MAG002Y]MCG7372749.1 polyhydroxyalkanoic acid system family protein [Pseudomonas luteola]MDN3234189.1 polyhydroxyalkanoic acid system family protein [Pseudomonas sp. WAC2]